MISKPRKGAFDSAAWAVAAKARREAREAQQAQQAGAGPSTSAGMSAEEVECMCERSWEARDAELRSEAVDVDDSD